MKRSEGYEPGWDLNVTEGDIGEQEVAEALVGEIEVKHKSYLDSTLYVELEHDRGRRGQYVASGLSTTTSRYWCWVVDDTGVMVFVPVLLLQQAVYQNVGRPAEEKDGDCPTRGRLIDLDSLLGFWKRIQ